MSRKKPFECGDLDGLDPRNELRSWLEQNNYIRFGSTRGAPYTHTFLNGGTALIPDDKHAVFLELMASELDSGRQWSVHEQATRFARLYFDLDIEESEYEPNSEVKLERIREWTSVIQRAVLEFFPGARVHSKDPNKTSAVGGQMIVLAAPVGYVTRKRPIDAKKVRSSSSFNATRQMAQDSQRLAIVQRVSTGTMPNQASVLAQIGKEASEEERVMRKTGLHIIFPNIVCDLNEMLDVRAHVVDKLQETFDSPGGGESWSKIVDVQVYTHSCGIRMPGTCKVETCGACKGDSKRKLKCNECNGRPRQFIDRPYKPVMVLTTTGTLNNRALRALQNSTDVMLKWCTIRQVNALQTSPPFVRPANVRAWSGTRVLYEIETPSKNNSSWANAKLTRTTGGGGGGSARKKSTQEAGDGSKSGRIQCGGATGNIVAYYGPEHEISGMVEKFIQQFTYPCWSQLQVSEVKHVLLPANGRYKQPASIYLVKVNGDNARYCLNVAREHNSSSIYFVIKKDGIEQRCWSGKPTVEGRVAAVPCSDFRSNTCEFLQYKLGRDLIRRLFPDTIESNVSLQRHVGIESIVRVEHHPGDLDSYPSLAEVRKHTDLKRKALGLATTPQDDDDDEDVARDSSRGSGRHRKMIGSGDGARDGSSTPPPDEQILKKRRVDASRADAARKSSSSSTLSTLSSGKTPIDALRLRRLEEQSPSFREIAPHSYVPDYDMQAASIDLLARSDKGKSAQVAPKLQKNSVTRCKERETIVTFPGLDPPKDIEEYKRYVKRSQDEISAVARYQIDQFLAK